MLNETKKKYICIYIYIIQNAAPNLKLAKYWNHLFVSFTNCTTIANILKSEKYMFSFQNLFSTQSESTIYL